MLAHDTLFEVYRQSSSDRLFGIGRLGEGVLVVEATGDAHTSTKVSFGVAVKKLGARLRAGFAKTGERMYFNERDRRFTHTHPDLEGRGLGWVVAATPPSLPAAIELVAGLVRAMPVSVIFPEEVDAWAQQQHRNAAHVVAFEDHCVWSLAIAQASLDHGWILRAARRYGELPDSPPSVSPQAWATWLGQHFTEVSVREAQRALGWTVERIIVSGTSTSIEENLSAFI